MKEDVYKNIFVKKLKYLMKLFFEETKKYTQVDFNKIVLKNCILPQELSDYLDLNKSKTPTYKTMNKLLKNIREYHLFKDLPSDFFFSESNNISPITVNIGKETGLQDEAIKKIKEINKQNKEAFNNFIIGTNADLWTNLQILNYIKEYKKTCLQLDNIIKILNSKKFSENLKKIYDLYLEFSDICRGKLPDIFFEEETWEINTMLELKIIMRFLKKKYNLESFPEVKKIYELLETKTYLEVILFPETSDPFYFEFASNEEGKEIPYLLNEQDFKTILDYDIALREFKILIDNNILPPKDIWTSIQRRFIKKATKNIEKITKYQVTEYLTLYMNK